MFPKNTTIIDPEYNDTENELTREEAETRADIVSEIEYTFCLALKKGEHYFGQAKIKFYVEKLPDTDEELFLNCNALAVADLKINKKLKTD